MQWQATRKTQSSTSWRPIINRSVVNILLSQSTKATRIMTLAQHKLESTHKHHLHTSWQQV